MNTTKQTQQIGSESSNAMSLGMQSLQKAMTGQSTTNYATIFDGFEEKGIALEDIKPRENVFTFNAWRALGRVVKKGVVE